MAATPVFPLGPGGAAEDAAALVGASSGFAITDLTACPRWGLKGPGSAAWLMGQGLALPEVNRHATAGSMTLLRLGRNDITLLADAENAAVLGTLTAHWEAASSPKGYESWRHESWAWLELSGTRLEVVLARLTAIDPRPGRFGADEIAQTRVAHVDAVFFRRGATFQLFFDIASTAAVVRRIAHAAGWPAAEPLGGAHP